MAHCGSLALPVHAAGESLLRGGLLYLPDLDLYLAKVGGQMAEVLRWWRGVAAPHCGSPGMPPALAPTRACL